MPPPFWVHCNICAASYKQDDKFYMLSCYHVMCKNCLRRAGCKKCPLCKKSIKFEELKKLPDKMKAMFKPDIYTELDKPIKMIKFQLDQQSNQFKLAAEFKTKIKKVNEAKAKLEKELKTLKAETDKLIHHRQLMQDKLKEIYYKKRSQPYRSPVANTSSSNQSSKSSGALSFESPTVNRNRPMFNSTLARSGASSAGSSFFEKSSSLQKPDRTISSGYPKSSRSSQSNRKPFFA